VATVNIYLRIGSLDGVFCNSHFNAYLMPVACCLRFMLYGFIFQPVEEWGFSQPFMADISPQLIDCITFEISSV